MKKGVDYIGVTCVFYCHDGKGNLLLHKRSKLCRDERGKWDCGGGAMRVGETFEQAVRREVKEEYATRVINLHLVGVNNVIRNNGGERTHWVAVIFAVQVDPTKVRIGETRKMEEIGWFKKNALPSPLHSMFLEHLMMVEDTQLI